MEHYINALVSEWVKSFSRVRLFATLWTVNYQAPPSMGFSRQEYLRGLLFPSPGDLPDPEIEPGSPTLQADALIWATRELNKLKQLHDNLTRWGKKHLKKLNTLSWQKCSKVRSKWKLSQYDKKISMMILEKAMATHSSVLAWRIPGTVEPGGLPSMGSHRVGHDWSDLAAAWWYYS